MSKEDFSVAVCVVTYNQEKYIRQCIESILSQQTEFRVDIIVGNDCSTDATATILSDLQKQHPNIVVLTPPANSGIVKNTLMVFQYIFEHGYKYVAMLDGDDWWCDCEKLQLQVDFLEQHSTYSMVYTRGGTYIENKNKYHHSESRSMPEGDLFPTLIHNYPILNGTVMHRARFLKTIDWEELESYNLLYFDYPTNVMMAAQGPIGYIDRETLIWRRGISSVSSPKSMERALRHADSQASQGIFLKRKFPNTPYDMPMSAFENYRQQMYYTYGMAHKNYSVVNKAVHHPDFPAALRTQIPSMCFLNSKILFLIYVYVIKKVKTLFSILNK